MSLFFQKRGKKKTGDKVYNSSDVYFLCQIAERGQKRKNKFKLNINNNLKKIHLDQYNFINNSLDCLLPSRNKTEFFIMFFKPVL